MILKLALLAQLAAFVGAQGGGTLTAGGRNGTVMEITNLNTSGAGSYSACVSASGPRTCICRVAGVVPIPKDVVAGSPFLTIDGQTCPGGGLILGDGKTTAGRALVIETHDVVVRYLTFNPNNPSTPVGPDTGTVGLEIEGGATNVVLDHLSCFFAGNKCIITYTSSGVPITNVTQQWNLFTLPNVGHPVGPMTDTNASAYLQVNQDFHHNFFSWIGHRIALYNTTQGRWVNNLTANWCDPNPGYGFAMEPQGPSQVDLIGNIWAPGNMNAGCSNPHPVNINATGSSDCTTNCWNGATTPAHYMSGNVCAQGTDWQCAAKISTEGGPETGVVPAAWQRSSPLPPEPNPILADPVTGLDTKILATVGNSQGLNCDGSWNTLHRNAIDSMVIQAYPKGNGALFNQQYPAPTVAAAPACPEDPVSHVPTAYLAARGIPAGTSPWKVMPGDVYPLIETYANGSGVTPPPVNPFPPGSSVKTTSQVNVRATPGGNLVGTQPSGALALVGSAAPVTTGTPPNTVTWYPLTFTTSPNGWVGGDQLVSTTPPPPVHPTVSCAPQSLPVAGTSQCTADQQVTWSASAGTITPAGLFTAPATAQTVQVTGTNANGSGSVPLTVTSVTPPPVVYPTVSWSIGNADGTKTTVVCTPTTKGIYTCAQQ